MVAAVKRLVWGRRFGGYRHWALAGCGPSFGGHGCGPEFGAGSGGGCRAGGQDDGEGHGHARWRSRWGHGGFGGPGRSFWLRAVFARLDTTPGQEREIRSAIEEFQSTLYDAKDGLKGVREDLARAISGESFDEIAAGEASGRADTAVSRAKDALASALKRIHAVLDPKQRERLAEILAKGPAGFGPRSWGNPYRAAGK
jgi:hypothetical protein